MKNEFIQVHKPDSIKDAIRDIKDEVANIIIENYIVDSGKFHDEDFIESVRENIGIHIHNTSSHHHLFIHVDNAFRQFINDNEIQSVIQNVRKDYNLMMHLELLKFN